MPRLFFALLLFLLNSQLVRGDFRGTMPSIIVHVEDAMTVPRWDLQPALDQTTRAFRAVNIQAIWRPAAAAALSPAEFTLVLLTPEMAARKYSIDHLGPAVLGSSAPAAHRAWIFVGRVMEVARSARLPVSDILGQVITHELGHLLLADEADALGVMREHIQLTGAASFRFTALQGQRMRTRLGDVLTAPPALARSSSPVR